MFLAQNAQNRHINSTILLAFSCVVQPSMLRNIAIYLNEPNSWGFVDWTLSSREEVSNLHFVHNIPLSCR